MRWLLILFFAVTEIGCSSISQKENFATETPQLIWNIDRSTSESKLQLLKSVEIELANIPNLIAIDTIQKEGTLKSDPKHSAADEALKNVSPILNWAICSKIANQPLQQKCIDNTAKGLSTWAETYQPTGNPINDVQLLRLIIAADLAMPYLNSKDKSVLSKWLRLFISKGDDYFEKLNMKDGKRINNWMTWRLAIRGLTAKVLQDHAVMQSTKTLIQEHSVLNFSKPQGWQPPTECNNSEDKYGGYDFRTRDAFHYHVYNLEGWVWILRFAPDLIDQATLNRIQDAFNFLQPYYFAKKTHVEFACSKIKFDTLRKNEGQAEFQNENWQPFRAKRLLLIAQIPLPEIRAWQAWKLKGSEPE